MAQINEFQKSWAISQEELNLRWDYGKGKITLKEFDRRYKKLLRQGKIIRDGKVVRE
jgi:hypothetical protein